jgi:hypothetical protein
MNFNIFFIFATAIGLTLTTEMLPISQPSFAQINKYSLTPIDTQVSKKLIPVNVKNGRLVFSSAEAFRETLDALSKKNEKELTEWESEVGFFSLRKYLDSTNNQEQKEAYGRLPRLFTAILNSHGEYQVNNDILWVNQNDIYLIPNNDEKLLLDLKKSNFKYPNLKKGKIIEKITPIKTQKSKEQFSNKNLTGLSSYQKQYKPREIELKIVFEAANYVVLVPAPNLSYATLEVRIKHEYWKKPRFGRGKWLPAGEQVNKNIKNLSASFCEPVLTQCYSFNSRNYSQHDNKDLIAQIGLSYWIGTSSDVFRVNYITGDFEASVDPFVNSGGYYRVPDARW